MPKPARKRSADEVAAREAEKLAWEARRPKWSGAERGGRNTRTETQAREMTRRRRQIQSGMISREQLG